MRVLDEDNVEVSSPDLDAGYLFNQTVVRQDAEPIDNVGKFAWSDDEYETIQRYMLWKPGEKEALDGGASSTHFVETAPDRISSLENASDDVLLLMADMIGGAL